MKVRIAYPLVADDPQRPLDPRDPQFAGSALSAVGAVMNRRHDLYRDMHKALHVALFDTARRLGRLDTEDPAELQRAIEPAQRLLALLASHLRLQNDFVHTAIEARRPGGALCSLDEQRARLEAIDALAAELATLQAVPAAERATLAQRLHRHFAAFVIAMLQHMQREEAQHNAALCALYCDAEVIALHQRLWASLPPALRLDALAWMARALNPHELAKLLLDLQRSAPPETFGAVLAQTRECLDDTRWARLTRALGLQPVPGLVA